MANIPDFQSGAWSSILHTRTTDEPLETVRTFLAVLLLCKSMRKKEIYFACSIRGGRDDAAVYGELIEYITTKAVVLSEIFADKTLTAEGMNDTSKNIYEKDIAWVCQADGIIAEVTNPSLGVGYEIAKAEEWGKPVLALFRETGGKKLSAMIDGSPYLEIVRYSDIEDAKTAINGFIQALRIK